MWLAYSNIWSQFLYGIAIIYVARQLLPSEFAPVAIAISVIPMMTAIADWGTISFYLRELSAGRIGNDLWRSLLRNQIIVAALFGAVTAAALSIFISRSIGILTGFTVFTLQSFQASQVLLRANHHFTSIARNNILYRLPLLTLPICHIFVPELLPECLISLIILGQFFGTLNIWNKSRKNFQINKTGKFVHFSDHWKRSGVIAWIPILTQLKGLDVFAWSLISGPTLTGNYGAVIRWGQPTEILAQAAISVESVRWSKLRTTREALQISPPTAVQILVSLVAALTLALFGKVLAPFFLGNTYVFVGPMLQLVGVASILSVVSNFFLTLLVTMRLQQYAFRGQALSLFTQGLVLFVLASIAHSTFAAPFALIAGYCVCNSYMMLAALRRGNSLRART